jgi:hypothetical protein
VTTAWSGLVEELESRDAGDDQHQAEPPGGRVRNP